MIEVYLEVGSRRSFAMATHWPGWGRSGKSEAAALEALASYRNRYAEVVRTAELELPEASFDIVERVEGNATTDFGAPGVVPELDRAALTEHSAERLLALATAAWMRFDAVASTAPESLRKGPRGGGRDTSKIVSHVDEAERAYLRKIGVTTGSRPTEELRAAAVDRIRSLAHGPEETKWPPAYYLRRSVWHVVDHLWEIEDRSDR